MDKSGLFFDAKAFEKKLTNFEKTQMPFAAAKALTDTAKDVQQELSEQLPRWIDRPTPFTQRAFGVVRATKNRLQSEVFVKAIQEQYLKYAIEGGTRTPKGTPGGSMKLNKYGNVPSLRGNKKLKALLSKPNVFRSTIKGIDGIWQRNRGGLKLLFNLNPKPINYEKRFPFERIAYRTAAARLHINLKRTLDHAIKTAK